MSGPPPRLAAPVPVKICGLTRPEDAALAVRLGARWLGVIFAGGPRQVTPAQARAIVVAAGYVPVIGVFGSQGRDEILRTREQAGLAGAQLHGRQSAGLVRELQGEGLSVLAVARLAGPADLDWLTELLALDCAVVVEPRVEGRLGGTGASLPEALAQAARQRIPAPRMVLAGGLAPGNVAERVRRIAPDAVDVSSGVEQIPGIKDPVRMARFLEELGWR